MSLRDQILKTNDITTEIVDVPEWKIKVKIRSMSAGERTKVQQAAADQKSGKVDLGVLFTETVLLTVLDPETNERAFLDEDREALFNKNGAVIEMLATKALSISGMNKESVDEVGKGS